MEKTPTATTQPRLEDNARLMTWEKSAARCYAQRANSNVRELQRRNREENGEAVAEYLD